MYTNIELRDPTDARRFLTQGLWWQRIVPVRAEHVAGILDWALAIASEGEPLPPLGFVADLGHMIFRATTNIAADDAHLGLPSLTRAYEDYVLGKLFADSSFERAADALRPYPAADRAKGLAFVVARMRERAGIAGVLLSPGAIKSCRETDPHELLREGFDSIEQSGMMPRLTSLYEQLVREIRNTANVLGVEDIFELEHKTALAPFGQRVALRQVLHAAALLAQTLPHLKPRPMNQRHEVPTRMLEEDTYPVGGFVSISTRGSIESLLHSQLAFMEDRDRPDLFDVKFLRDELLYYSRDENSFLRRRRTFIFALYPDLTQARFKDAELPYQRVILLLALLRTSVLKLTDWLNTEALVFEVILIEAKGAPALTAERELLTVLLAAQIANATVSIEALPADQLAERCVWRARRSGCHCLLASAKEQTLDAEGAFVSRLTLDAPTPNLGLDGDSPSRPEAETPWLAWTAILERLLIFWI